MSYLFISDVHLTPEQPEVASQLLDFLETSGSAAKRLYLLGDIFDSWVGDDDPSPLRQPLTKILKRISDKGTDVFFMAGNRDFMVGQQFADESGVTLLDDPVVHDLFGEQVLISHGDQYCTDDMAYQEFRALSRQPQWQHMMLEKSVEERLAFAKQARAQSQAHTQETAMDIMDVNKTAVQTALDEAGVTTLLHGHTHRPAVHHWQQDEADYTRIVLGDWHNHGSVLRWNRSGYELLTLPRKATLSKED